VRSIDGYRNFRERGLKAAIFRKGKVSAFLTVSKERRVESECMSTKVNLFSKTNLDNQSFKYPNHRSIQLWNNGCQENRSRTF